MATDPPQDGTTPTAKPDQRVAGALVWALLATAALIAGLVLVILSIAQS